MKTFKEKADEHKKLLDKLETLKNDQIESAVLFDIFSSFELDKFHLIAHETFKDFSGAVVSGANYKVNNLPLRLQKLYEKATKTYLKELGKEIDDLEKEIEILENS